MDDLAFEREKFRRETQELLNAIDAAIASDEADQFNTDTMVLIKYTAISFTQTPKNKNSFIGVIASDALAKRDELSD